MSLILSTVQGQNRHLFPGVLALHAKPGDVIADVTYGKGNFWKDVDTSIYDLRASDLSTGVDCRSLPYGDGSVDIVVLDPPYIYNPKDTVKASISSPYRVNESGAAGQGLTTTAAVLDLYEAAMAEAHRVLRKGGYLMVKCQDQIESNRQRWMHVTIFEFAASLGMYGKDLFILMQNGQPTSRWPNQYHSRKNHSYLWVFERRRP